MLMDKAAIRRLIPHQGSMCLLDAVEEWDETRIRCRSGSHRDPDNPLRSRGRLHALCGIEYAAQAMAVHGGLRAAAGSGPGYLAAVRELTLAVEHLDDIADALRIEAECLLADARTLLYGFTIAAGGRTLLQGRASVFLSAGES